MINFMEKKNEIPERLRRLKLTVDACVELWDVGLTVQGLNAPYLPENIMLLDNFIVIDNSKQNGF